MAWSRVNAPVASAAALDGISAASGAVSSSSSTKRQASRRASGVAHAPLGRAGGGAPVGPKWSFHSGQQNAGRVDLCWKKPTGNQRSAGLGDRGNESGRVVRFERSRAPPLIEPLVGRVVRHDEQPIIPVAAVANPAQMRLLDRDQPADLRRDRLAIFGRAGNRLASHVDPQVGVQQRVQSAEAVETRATRQPADDQILADCSRPGLRPSRTAAALVGSQETDRCRTRISVWQNSSSCAGRSGIPRDGHSRRGCLGAHRQPPAVLLR